MSTPARSPRLIKPCTRCGKDLPVTDEHFFRRKGADGWGSWCKPCARDVKRERRRAYGVQKRPPPQERFWSKVDKNGPVLRPELGPCWLWMAGCFRDGRGAFSVKGVTKSAYRYAWELTHWAVPRDRQLNHHCDNPKCVNPSHLYVGTHRENMADKITRQTMPRGPRLLAGEQIAHARLLHENGLSTQHIALVYKVSASTIERWIAPERMSQLPSAGVHVYTDGAYP